MGRILRTDDNVVEIPANVSVMKTGYVYLNTSTWWGEKADGTGKGARHTKECIGLAVNPGAWKSDRRMWANARYWELFEREDLLPEPPAQSDCMSVGFVVAARSIADMLGLTDCLDEAFGIRVADTVLDLAAFALERGSVSLEGLGHWARRHPVLKATNEDAVGECLAGGVVDDASTREFGRLWAARAIGDGRLLLCWDEVGSDRWPEGAYLMPEGTGVVDKEECRDGVAYAVRASDGLPVAFEECWGSPWETTDATEAIERLEGLLEEGEASTLDVTAVLDRGCVPEWLIREMIDAGMGVLMVLGKDTEVADAALAEMARALRTKEHYREALGCYTSAERRQVLTDGTEFSLHAVFDPELAARDRFELERRLDAEKTRLERVCASGERITEVELERLRHHFTVRAHEEGTLILDWEDAGRCCEEEVPAYVVDAFSRDRDRIDLEEGRTGVCLLATSAETDAQEAMGAYGRCRGIAPVAFVLQDLEGISVADAYLWGVRQAKSVVWFCAAVLYAHIASVTAGTVGSDGTPLGPFDVISLLEEIEATRGDGDKAYRRRHRLTGVQERLLSALGLTEADLDEAAGALGDW